MSSHSAPGTASNPPVRVRFAPSPTGYLHVGGARTALFNWLYARHHGGKFILRIEDTDRERSTKESEQEILDSMRWLGLDWDEGPIYQSKRVSRYLEHAQKLLAKGLAYAARDPKGAPPTPPYPPQQVGREIGIGSLPPREAGRVKGAPPYPPREAGRVKDGGGEAIIYKMQPRKIAWEDMIYGHIEFDSADIKDQVLIKSDGMPAYNFACVVDDAEMGINPVIRGEDHISNTPKQIVLYEALGLTPPRFAHVPLILGPDYSRLSKRHGATSVGSYHQEGYLAKAMVNYLVLLGWSSGTQQEIFGLEDLVRLFDLDKISRKGAVFATEKLQWMNAHYIKELSEAELINTLTPYLTEAGFVKPGVADARVPAVAHLLKERLRLLRDIVDFGACFFREDVVLDEAAAKKFLLLPGNGPMLDRLNEVLKPVEPFEPAPIEKEVRAVIEEFKVKSTPLIQMIRVALTGKSVGAGLFETMAVLGKPACLTRLKKARAMIA